MIGNIGPLEIGLVLLVALLVFGPKKLPELGSGLGRGMREFKEGVTGEKRAEGHEEIGSSAGRGKATNPNGSDTAQAGSNRSGQ